MTLRIALLTKGIIAVYFGVFLAFTGIVSAQNKAENIILPLYGLTKSDLSDLYATDSISLRDPEAILDSFSD